jgi:hypothetical protein
MKIRHMLVQDQIQARSSSTKTPRILYRRVIMLEAHMLDLVVVIGAVVVEVVLTVALGLRSAHLVGDPLAHLVMVLLVLEAVVILHDTVGQDSRVAYPVALLVPLDTVPAHLVQGTIGTPWVRASVNGVKNLEREWVTGGNNLASRPRTGVRMLGSGRKDGAKVLQELVVVDRDMDT